MNLEELRMLNNEIITEEQYDLIQEIENVTIQSNGISGYHTGHNWYTAVIELENDTEEVEIYL